MFRVYGARSGRVESGVMLVVTPSSSSRTVQGKLEKMFKLEN